MKSTETKSRKSIRGSVLIAAGSVVAGGLGAAYLVTGPMASAETAQVADSGSTGSSDTSGATGTPGAAANPDRAAQRTARVQSVLAPLVADGTITQAQADKVAAALVAAGPMGDRGPRGDATMRGPKMKKFPLKAAATAIGISVDELRSELRAGKSIADVATAKSVAVQKVIDALVAAATTRIDAAVTAGKMTSEQATGMKGELVQRITDRVNSAGGVGAGREGGHHRR